MNSDPGASLHFFVDSFSVFWVFAEGCVTAGLMRMYVGMDRWCMGVAGYLDLGIREVGRER